MTFIKALTDYFDGKEKEYQKYVGKKYRYGKQEFSITKVDGIDFRLSTNIYVRCEAFLDDVKNNVYEEIKEN